MSIAVVWFENQPGNYPFAFRFIKMAWVGEGGHRFIHP